MYDFGKQFKFNYDLAKSKIENMIVGSNYRFTILSDSLIRLEYNEKGKFEDRPTEFAWFRNMEKVEYEKKESNKVLEIRTNNFILTYIKERPFEGTKINPVINLKVSLKNSDQVWYYKNVEARNYGALGLSLDNTDGKIKLAKGLYSPDGFVSIDDSSSRIMDVDGNVILRDNQEIDIYLFMYGGNYLKCLNDYYMISGKPALVPRYALGNWWSKKDTYNQIVLDELVDDFFDKEIPLSVVLLNENWAFHNKKQNGFSWNTGYFPNATSYIKKLYDKQIRLGVTIDPSKGFNDYESTINIIRKYLNTDEKGIVPFNVYDPRWIDVYLKVVINPLNQTGIAFYNLDTDEKIYNKEIWLLNHYHFYNDLKDYNRRPFVLSKNGMMASHRYPITYTGKLDVSWDSLKLMSLLNILSTNIGNNFITYDVGGFKNGKEDSELYIRFVQLGTFSPILNLGSDAGYFYKRAPWKWDYKTYKIAKDFLNLRHRLVPYLYSESYKYYKFSIPMIIPLYYKYPSYYDDSLFKYEYYLGSQLFIAPILTKKEQVMDRVLHKFFLPEGTWYHYETGKKYDGKKSYVAFYKDEDFPMFVKAGTIIPMLPKDRKIINDMNIPQTLEFDIYPGANNTYDLYEDDGITEYYKYGGYLLTRINYRYVKDNHKITIQSIEGQSSIVPTTRNYLIRFKNVREAENIKVYFNRQPINFKKYIKNISFVVEIENVPSIGTLDLEISGENIDIEAESLAKYDIVSIIQDLPVETLLKTEIFKIIFDEKSNIKDKKIKLKKLEKKGLDKKFIILFFRLLEYLAQV